MTELAWLSAGEIGALYRRRALSPVELVRACLDQIARHEPEIHAFTLLDADAALEAARQAERELSAGTDRGPLHGVPVGIKDVIDVAGLRTSCHSRLRLKHRAPADAPVVARVRQAGGIVLGKLATHEFALGGPSFDLPWPPARNPWNPARHPGGSSSGSGAGLAAGFFPLAIGTDTGGSIRHPAGACGVVGLKPTYGAVPTEGVFPVAWSLDTVGPMARSVGDAGLLLDAMVSEGPGLSAGPGGRAGPNRPAEPGPDLAGLRIGFVRGFHERDVVADPEVAAALEAVAGVLADAGATVRDAACPPLGAFAVPNRIILTAEAWAVHAAALRRDAGRYGALSRQRILVGAFLSAGDLVHARRRQMQLTRAVDRVFEQCDVLLVANSMDPPCRIDDEAALARNYGRQARIPFNLTGHPALALMAGLSSDGMPLSCQFVGRHGQERQVLRVAHAYERATDWHAMRPPLGTMHRS